MIDLEKAYSLYIAYRQSKTGNILLSVALTKALNEKGILSFSVHPRRKLGFFSFGIGRLRMKPVVNSYWDGPGEESR